ncbi:branched-chain amino acid ABC transporter permease [Streptomyces sp. 6N223]|uniref:branched-chain amino acid ABC transporter permease n=1 Tax=Streptomyces sp. 6N223 TaxID=3457412 RepID=UPI003FCFD969
MNTVGPGQERAAAPPPSGAARSPARGHRAGQGRRPVLIAAAVAAATLALPPQLDSSQLSVYILLGLSAMVAVGLTLLMGYAGQVSIGQGAFYAIGAYAAALLGTHDVPPLLALAAAPLAAAACAAVIGGPLLRLRGHQLAFATIAVQLILISLLGEWEWAGGSIGVSGIPLLSIGGFEFDEDLHYAYLTWAAVVLVVLAAHNITASRVGRALRALATSETAASASGVPVTGYKVAVFTLAAAFAGLAGGIFAFYIGYIAPHSFPVLLSVEYLVMVVVGGLGSLWGALLGAAAITLLVQVLGDLATMPGMPATAPVIFSYAVYATLLILVVLFLPRGLVSVPSRATRLLRGGRT